MSKEDKLLKRFLAKPKDFTYNELKRFLACFDYKEIQGRGSRVSFVNSLTDEIVSLHKPHPRPELKRYQLDLIEEHLNDKGKI